MKAAAIQPSGLMTYFIWGTKRERERVVNAHTLAISISRIVRDIRHFLHSLSVQWKSLQNILWQYWLFLERHTISLFRALSRDSLEREGKKGREEEREILY